MADERLNHWGRLKAAAFRDGLDKLGWGFEAAGRSAYSDDTSDVLSSQKSPRFRDARVTTD